MKTGTRLYYAEQRTELPAKMFTPRQHALWKERSREPEAKPNGNGKATTRKGVLSVKELPTVGYPNFNFKQLQMAAKIAVLLEEGAVPLSRTDVNREWRELNEETATHDEVYELKDRLESRRWELLKRSGARKAMLDRFAWLRRMGKFLKKRSARGWIPPKPEERPEEPKKEYQAPAPLKTHTIGEERKRRRHLKRTDVVVGDKLKLKNLVWKVAGILELNKDGVPCLGGKHFVAKIMRVRKPKRSKLVPVQELMRAMRKTGMTVRPKPMRFNKLVRQIEWPRGVIEGGEEHGKKRQKRSQGKTGTDRVRTEDGRGQSRSGVPSGTRKAWGRERTNPKQVLVLLRKRRAV